MSELQCEDCLLVGKVTTEGVQVIQFADGKMTLCSDCLDANLSMADPVGEGD